MIERVLLIYKLSTYIDFNNLLEFSGDNDDSRFSDIKLVIRCKDEHMIFFKGLNVNKGEIVQDEINEFSLAVIFVCYVLNDSYSIR